MKCPKCQFDNREEVKFCEECGAKLELTCPHCGAKIPLGRKFCGECGGDLGKPSEARSIDYTEPQSYTPRHLADKILTSRSSIEGEHKLVTVLFADVANYTFISENLDPEEVHQVMDGCFKIIMDEIHKYEGTINQFTGDGVMALFGAPVAHEDHAQRACYSALSIQRAMGIYGDKIKKDTGVDFAMRIGLNSGHVIVGSIGNDLRMDYTAVGDTTNLAARIQQSARPGEVWLSQDTQSIIRGFFQVELVGDLELKGKAEPQPTYRLVSEHKKVRTRFEAGLAKGVTKLVGRRPEMEILKTAWERTKSGEARVVDVVGEAGVGKSRLAYEFQNTIADEATILTGVCIHYGRNINFLPIIDIVRSAFNIEEGLSEKEVERLIGERATGELAAMVPFYLNLLSLKVDDPQFNSLNPEGRKYGTFEAVKDLLLAQSQGKPLVVFIEDVHWIDKISEELLHFFTRCMHSHPIMMLTAYRPEANPPWTKGAHYRQIGLETLSLKSSGHLVRNILGGLKLEPTLEEKIVAKTGGNPFFVEEMVRELVERGDLVKVDDRYESRRPFDQLEVPDSVQGVLAARIDRLSEDLKRTMQVASVIGKDFAFRLLKSIMELGNELRTHLTNLVGLEILYEKALYPELEYIFKHALTQEVAYDSLLKQRRQKIHARIAQAIEGLYSDQLEEHHEMLAHHYERSGNATKAVNYLILAGEKSNRNSASHTAYEFFNKAIEIADSADITLEPKTEVRAHQGMAQASQEIGDIDTALIGYRKAVAISRRYSMNEYEMRNLANLAWTMWWAPVATMKDEVIRFYDEAIARAQAVGDKAAESRILSNKGLYFPLVGHRGDQMLLEAERLALETGNQQAILTNRSMRALSERWYDGPKKTIELTEGLLETLRSTYNWSQVSGLIFVRGLALAELGRIEDGIEIIRDGIEICEKLGGTIMLGRLYNSLGYCYQEIHLPERAWSFNLQSEEVARELMEQYPMGREMAGEVVAQAYVNLMENLFDQGKAEKAWIQMKSFEEETKSADYDRARDQRESRMNYLTAQILLERNSIGEAEALISKNLERARKEHRKKREGGFLRLQGEVHVRRKEFENAIVNFREAIKILREVGNPRQLWQTHASLASAFDLLRRFSEAREQWGAASEIVNNVAKDISDRELRDGFLRAEPIRNILSKATS